MITKNEFLRELEKVFLLNPGTINESDTLDDFGVDSTGMLELIVLLATKVGVKVDVDAILAIQTVGDIILMVDDKLS